MVNIKEIHKHVVLAAFLFSASVPCVGSSSFDVEDKNLHSPLATLAGVEYFNSESVMPRQARPVRTYGAIGSEARHYQGEHLFEVRNMLGFALLEGVPKQAAYAWLFLAKASFEGSIKGHFYNPGMCAYEAVLAAEEVNLEALQIEALLFLGQWSIDQKLYEYAWEYYVQARQLSPTGDHALLALLQRNMDLLRPFMYKFHGPIARPMRGTYGHRW